MRTFFASVIPVLAGVFSGSFVTEITKGTGLVWATFYQTYSFYSLVVLSLLTYWYNKAVYMYERQITRFLDEDYCVAYMRSKCLPEAAERYQEMIRNGNGGELVQAMTEVKRILK
jgi:hypothetical protein